MRASGSSGINQSDLSNNILTTKVSRGTNKPILQDKDGPTIDKDG